MLIRHRSATPQIDVSAYIAPTAVIVGRVRIEANAHILYGAAVNAEGSQVEIGACSIISENAVLRATASAAVDAPVILGDHVFVGSHATLLGCRIEPCSFIATGTTVLHTALGRSGAVVAVGALVHAGTVIPEDFFVPPNAIAMGEPVTLHDASDRDKLVEAIKSLGFCQRAFGVDVRAGDRASTYRNVAEVRSEEYAAHFEDVVVHDHRRPNEAPR